MSKRTYAGESLEEILARNEAYDRKVMAMPEYATIAGEVDREYEVAKVMEAARKHAKMTQAQVAEKMGTTQSSIARMLKSNITISTLSRYLRACNARLKIAACW